MQRYPLTARRGRVKNNLATWGFSFLMTKEIIMEYFVDFRDLPLTKREKKIIDYAVNHSNIEDAQRELHLDNKEFVKDLRSIIVKLSKEALILTRPMYSGRSKETKKRKRYRKWIEKLSELDPEHKLCKHRIAQLIDVDLSQVRPLPTSDTPSTRVKGCCGSKGSHKVYRAGDIIKLLEELVEGG